MTQNPDNRSPDSKGLYRSRQLDAIADRWNAKAGHWDRDVQNPSCHLNEDQAYSRFLDRLSRVVGERASFCRRNGVLDAGCATGLVLAHILPSFAWGFGVDISPEMIRIAAAKDIPNARFAVGDCFKLASICPKAGAVISRGVLLSHYGHSNAVDLLRSAHDVLVKGGFIFWDFLNQPGRAKASHAPENKAYFEPRQICELASEAGFVNARSLTDADRRVGLLLAETA